MIATEYGSCGMVLQGMTGCVGYRNHKASWRMQMSSIRIWAKELKQQTLVVYFAARDARTPWPVRLLALSIAAYAFSPIDLIPDFIPILGYLDDLIIVPLGLLLVLRLVPHEVMLTAREKASIVADRPVSRVMAATIVAAWAVVLGVVGYWAWQTVRS